MANRDSAELNDPHESILRESSDAGSVPPVSERRIGSRRLLPRLPQRNLRGAGQAVTEYLSAMGLSGRQGTCANCDEDRKTFRTDLPS